MSKSKLNPEKIPQHVAVIMDGNGRWAKKNNQPRVYGHKNGVKAVREVVEAAGEIGVKHLTLYAFSTENWNRPKYEINALMQLLVNTINTEINTLHKNNIKLSTIGDVDNLPSSCKKELEKAKTLTKDNTGLNLVLALSYSSKWEITQAVKKIAQKVKNKVLKVDEISEETISQHLNTASIPDPELLIRTSGELRISNFLLWQIAYAELYFTDKFWPEFTKQDFFEAIFDYQNRERRFGLTSEQIQTLEK
ncbi:MAG: isoprenyl transferase [Vicingaceae bacterium]